MNRVLTEHKQFYCEAKSGLIQFPVDKILIGQRKCRTQALKQLLSIPLPSTNRASRSWRLNYIVADLIVSVQVKLRERFGTPALQ